MIIRHAKADIFVVAFCLATDIDSRVANLVNVHKLDPNPPGLDDVMSQESAISFAKVRR